MPENEIWTRADVMAYLRISRSMLDRLMKRREIPFAKIGKKVVFKRASVVDWLEARIVEVKPEK